MSFNAFGLFEQAHHPSQSETSLVLQNRYIVDYETVSSYKVNCIGRDHGSLETTQGVEINVVVTDANEIPIPGTHGKNVFTVLENSRGGTTVGRLIKQVAFHDQDGDSQTYFQTHQRSLGTPFGAASSCCVGAVATRSAGGPPLLQGELATEGRAHQCADHRSR